MSSTMLSSSKYVIRGALFGMLFILMSCGSRMSPTPTKLPHETVPPEATLTPALLAATLPQPTITVTNTPIQEPDLSIRSQVWATLWEELTELMFVGTVIYLLWVFQHTLLPAFKLTDSLMQVIQ